MNSSPTIPADPVSVLLVCHSYPPVLGGSEIEAQRVSAALLQRGHRVKVLCAAADVMPRVTDWTDPFGVPVRIFGGGWPSRWRDHIFALGVAWTLLKERRSYQVVYFLMQGLHLATGLPMARLLNKPVLMKVSGSGIIPVLRQSWLGRLELKWLRQWAYRVMVLNPGMFEEATAGGLDPAQLVWMPNPVDTAAFANCSEAERRLIRRELAVNGPVVLYVGRLAPEKELPVLIAGFAQIAKQFPGATLVLVGEGECRAELEALAAEKGIAAHVRLTGRLEMSQVARWLKAADVFALVSSNEGLSCSLLEAMSTGLPALVSDIPANTQLIEDRVHGLVTRLGEETSIATALTRLLGDDTIRAQMGRAARQRVKKQYAIATVIDQYETLFCGAIRAAKAITDLPDRRG